VREDVARDAIVAYAKRLYDRGLIAGASGNVSVRLDDGSLLATPTLASLGTLRASDLVVCAADGSSFAGDRRPTSELPLHVAAYRVRPEIRCVVHTHPTHCVAWSKTGALFPLDTVGAIESLGSIGFTRYERSGTVELAGVCSDAFAHGFDTIVMERHGLSSVAEDLETAFLRTDLAEQTAHIEFVAATLGARGVPRGRGEPVVSMSDNESSPPPIVSPRRERPDVPLEDWRRAAGEHPEANAALDAFHSEYSSDAPDRERLGGHVERVRGFADVAGPFERWWLDPRVQAFVAELNATGI